MSEIILNNLIQRYPSLTSCQDDIFLMYSLLKSTYENGNKFLVAGNGGSCADADHIVGELMKGFCSDRKINDAIKQNIKNATDSNEDAEYLCAKLQGALPAISLHSQSSLLTATLNDIDSDIVYAQSMLGYGKKGDCFLAISTSGNSRNVLLACIVAKSIGVKVIGLTGANGGKLKEVADVCVCVPETETYKIQELHLPIYHAVCLMLEKSFFTDTEEI